VPLIGMGGICTANDALEFIIAGASAFSVGTALFWNPSVCKQILAGLRDYMMSQGVGGISEVVGTLRLH